MVTLRRLGVACFAGIVAAQCYMPNGTDRHSVSDIGKNTYKPCESSTNGHSMCCNTFTGDTCRDGLCWNQGARVLWRESCTDPTWQSPKCLKLCIDSKLKVSPNTTQAQTDMPVTQCSDGSYCCGNTDPARKCCESGQGVKIVNGQVVAPSSSTSTSSTSTASTTSPTDASTSAGSTTSTANTNGNRSAVIGGAVGGTLGALALIGGVLGFWMFRRRQRRSFSPVQAMAGNTARRDTLSGGGEGTYFKELSADQQRFELYGGTPPITPSR